MVDTLIQFKILKDIGNNEGKNSQVYFAKDEQLNAELIIKKVNKSSFNDIDYFSEARMLYESRHANIMEIQYASQDKDHVYFAMPYYKNGSLNTLLEQRHLTIRQIITYAIDFLSGLNYIHSRKLLHLDIKPTNILIDASGRAVLTDFGLSKYMNDFGVAVQDLSYSMHRVPEGIRSGARTVESDIYQAGVTMYRMCNGTEILNEQIKHNKIKNIQELNEKILKGNFPDRKYYLPHIPKQLRKIINKMINIDLEKRYTNVVDILNDLSDIDVLLDWVFTNNTKEMYYYDNTMNRISVEVDTINKKIVTNKYIKKSGNTQKCKDHCVSFSDSKEMSQQLERILQSF